MMQVEDVVERSDIDLVLAEHPESNFLQSWEWGEFSKALGKSVVRRKVGHKAIYTAVVENSRRGIYMTIAGGPLMDYADEEIRTLVFDDIKAVAIAHNCVFVRIRPQLESNVGHKDMFKLHGLKPAPMPLSVEHAGVLDLASSEEEIIAGMSQSLRRKIRKAQKAGIEIDVSTDPGRLDTFYDIHAEHAARMGYVPFTKDFLVKQFSAFGASDRALMYTASKDGSVIAQNFMIFYGEEASYHYGVSTSDGVKLSSAPLLHLAAMEEARSRECSRYNFWGIVDDDDTEHRYYGVSQFKRSFGVSDLKHLPAHDLIISKARYRANWLLETARRKHRKL